jgi:hypothetical protein
LKEKEIRDRIQGFLKRTARAVVVPASVGLGLSAGACDRTSLQGRSADAAGALSASDAAVVSPDTADAVPDLSFEADLPVVLPPYLLAMGPDAQPDLQPIDGAPDTRSDAEPDLATPPPPYMVPPVPDAGHDLPTVAPPYLLLPSLSPPPSPGGTVPVPPKRTE